jgi:hypothetical protein
MRTESPNAAGSTDFGFYSRHPDPLGGLDVETADYSWLTQQIVAIADRHGEGRVVSNLVRDVRVEPV